MRGYYHPHFQAKSLSEGSGTWPLLRSPPTLHFHDNPPFILLHQPWRTLASLRGGWRREKLAFLISISLIYCWWHEVDVQRPPEFQAFRVGGEFHRPRAPILRPPDAKSWLTGKDSDAGRDWRQEEKGTTEEWDGWMASPTWWTWVWVNSRSGDGQGGLVCLDSWGCKESDTTEWLKWTELNHFLKRKKEKLLTFYCDFIEFSE